METTITGLKFLDYYFDEKDAIILIGIFYRDIGNMPKAETYFNKLFNLEDVSNGFL